MKNFFNFLFVFIIFISLAFLPIDKVLGAGLVPCDGATDKCDYDAFITLINNVVEFIVINLALPLAAIAFAYAGFLFLTSAENPGQRTRAKSIFKNVLIGLLFIGGSYLIVKTVLDIFGYTDAGWLGF